MRLRRIHSLHFGLVLLLHDGKRQYSCHGEENYADSEFPVTYTSRALSLCGNGCHPGMRCPTANSVRLAVEAGQRVGSAPTVLPKRPGQLQSHEMVQSVRAGDEVAVLDVVHEVLREQGVAVPEPK